MTGEERKNLIMTYISSGDDEKPVSATELAGKCNVSRQVIVNDIALLRAKGHSIIATNRGYILGKNNRVTRVFKVIHDDNDVQKELYGIVDLGGTVVDVFINHKAYGRVQAELNINSRKKVDEFVEKIKTGKSSPLKNITSNYHYHTVSADSEEILDEIEEMLKLYGFFVHKE